MGMYNEVFKRCPSCGGRGYMQISQIVLGFGGFDLDNPEALGEELNEEQLYQLVDLVKEDDFVCDNCSHVFPLQGATGARIELAKKLFGSGE